MIFNSTLLKFLLLIFSAFLLMNCQKQDVPSSFDNTDMHINENSAKPDAFTLENFDDERIKNELHVFWNDPKEVFIHGKKLQEYETDFSDYIVSNEGSEKIKFIYKVLQDEDNFKILKFQIIDTSIEESVSLENLDTFSGSISTFSLNGTELVVKGYQKGKLVSTWNKPDKPSRILTRNVPPNGKGCYKNIYVTSLVDWYREFGGFNNHPPSYEYTHTTYVGVRFERVYLYDCGGPTVRHYDDHRDGNGPNGGGGNGNVNHPRERIVKVTNKLTGKADCVYQNMVDNNDNINWIINNFKNKNNSPSEFNLEYKLSSTMGNITNATTVKSGNNFIITLNANRIAARTSLSIARTLIHESIHARLREFASRNGSNSTTFPAIYNFYRTYGENWDHQQMASFYRETIAKGLKQYDNSQHSDQFYMDLAWEGLSEIKDENYPDLNSTIYTEAWKKELNKTRVLQTITNEKQNGNKNCQPK